MTELQLLKEAFSKKEKILNELYAIGDKKSAYPVAYALLMMLVEKDNNKKQQTKYALNVMNQISWEKVKDKYDELAKISNNINANQHDFLDEFTTLSLSENTEIKKSDVEKLINTITALNCQKRLHVCSNFPEIENNNDFPKDVIYLKQEKKSFAMQYRLRECVGENRIEIPENIFNDLISKINEPYQQFSTETYGFFQERLASIPPKQNSEELEKQQQMLQEGLETFEKKFSEKQALSSEKNTQLKSSVKKLQNLIKKKSPHQLFNVPGDGHCLFWSVALGLLTPKLNDAKLFGTMYQCLFGSEHQHHLALVKQQLLNFSDKNLNALKNDPLENLVCKIFRGRVVDTMEKILDSFRKSLIATGYQENLTWEEYARQMRVTDMWGGQAEILAIEHLANVKIFVENSSYQSESQSEEILQLKLINNNHFQFYVENALSEKLTNHQILPQQYIDVPVVDVPVDTTQFDEGKLEKHLKEFQKLNAFDDQRSLALKTKIERIQKSFMQFGQWQAKDIQAWAEKAKVQFKQREPKETEMAEIIAVIDRANYIATYQVEHKEEPKHKGQRLRDTQILSLLLALEATPDKGRLLQVKTGQGKTTIMAALAVIKALQDESIDIITSSSILAERDAEEKKAFYELFNLTVANNNHDPNYLFGPRECYEANIIYGSVENFQFDLLNHEYRDLETRGTRDFTKTTALVDEVDSMLLDNGGHVAKLSTPMPGMEALQSFYIKIWRLMQDKEALLLADLREKETTEEGKSTETYQAKIKQFFSAEEKNKLVEEVVRWIDANNPPLPNFLKNYAKNQAKVWIDNVFKAYYKLEEEIDYRLIEDDLGQEVIVPIDFSNTGITQSNTLWGDGLHQFLQLKHQCQLTTESPTTAFISNVDYFLRYARGKIFGMSGTLGGDQERYLLGKIYHLVCLNVPTYEPSRLTRFPTQFADTQEDWFKQNVNEAFQAATGGQAVLLLCETRQDALKFEALLKEKNAQNALKIKSYIDEDDATVTEEQVESGTIIIATNLAGRGTDLKTTKDIDHQGGLYVLETFFATNLRVQEQADGRTARQGKLGHARFILEKQRTMHALDMDESQWEEIKNHHQPLNELNRIREKQEKLRLEMIEHHELPTLRVHDALFKQYNALCHDLKKHQERKRKNDQHDETFNIKLQALEDCFGFWLMLPTTLETIKQIKVHKNEALITENIIKCFQSFKQGVIEAFNSNNLSNKLDEHVIQNPIYYTKMGHYWLGERNFNNAKQSFEKAQEKIGINSPFNIANAYHLASIAIEQNNVIEKKLLEIVESLLPFLKPLLNIATENHNNYKTITNNYLTHTLKNLEALNTQIQTALDTLFWQGIMLVKDPLQKDQQDAVCRGENYLLIKRDNLYFLGFCNKEGRYEESQILDVNKISSQNGSTIKNDQMLRQMLEGLIRDKKGFTAQELMLLQPSELAKGFRTQLSILGLFKAQIDEQQKFCREHERKEWVIRNYSSVSTRDNFFDLSFSKEAIDSMSENAMHTFSSLGLDRIYQFGEIQSIDEKVKNGAIGQISGALALLSAGGAAAVFTCGQSLYYAMSIAAVMISEALTDLLTELLLTREEKMSTAEYAIGKAVTYGTALLGAELTQLFKTPMILQRAISGCQKFTAKLNRFNTVFKGIAGRSAGLLKRAEGKLATRLNSLKKAAELEKDVAKLTKQKDKLEKTAAKLRKNNQMNKAEKITNKANKLEGNIDVYRKALAKKQPNLTGAKIAKRIAEETGLDVGMTAIIMKVLEPLITELLELLQPDIENAVFETIKNDKELRPQLIAFSENDIQQKAFLIFEESLSKQIGEACKNISVNLLTRVRSIKIKLLATGLDFTVAIRDSTTLTESFCKKLTSALANSSANSSSENNNTIDEKIKPLSQLITSTIMQNLTSPITRSLATHLVGPLISGRSVPKKKASSTNAPEAPQKPTKPNVSPETKNPLSNNKFTLFSSQHRVEGLQQVEKDLISPLVENKPLNDVHLRIIANEFGYTFHIYSGKHAETEPTSILKPTTGGANGKIIHIRHQIEGNGHFYDLLSQNKFKSSGGKNDCLLGAFNEATNHKYGLTREHLKKIIQDNPEKCIHPLLMRQISMTGGMSDKKHGGKPIDYKPLDSADIILLTTYFEFIPNLSKRLQDPKPKVLKDILKIMSDDRCLKLWQKHDELKKFYDNNKHYLDLYNIQKYQVAKKRAGDLPGQNMDNAQGRIQERIQGIHSHVMELQKAIDNCNLYEQDAIIRDVVEAFKSHPLPGCPPFILSTNTHWHYFVEKNGQLVKKEKQLLAQKISEILSNVDGIINKPNHEDYIKECEKHEKNMDNFMKNCKTCEDSPQFKPK